MSDPPGPYRVWRVTYRRPGLVSTCYQYRGPTLEAALRNARARQARPRAPWQSRVAYVIDRCDAIGIRRTTPSRRPEGGPPPDAI